MGSIYWKKSGVPNLEKQQIGNTYIKVKKQGNTNNPQQQQMQMIGKVMPIFFGFISWTLPSGLVVYFLTGNIFRIGQQALIVRLEENQKDKEKNKEKNKEKEDQKENDENKEGPVNNTSRKKRKKRRRK